MAALQRNKSEKILMEHFDRRKRRRKNTLNLRMILFALINIFGICHGVCESVELICPSLPLEIINWDSNPTGDSFDIHIEDILTPSSCGNNLSLVL